MIVCCCNIVTYPVWKQQRPSRATSPSFISGCLVGCWNGSLEWQCQFGWWTCIVDDGWKIWKSGDVALFDFVWLDSYKMISLQSPPLQFGLFFKLSCLSILREWSSFFTCSFGSLPRPLRCFPPFASFLVVWFSLAVSFRSCCPLLFPVFPCVFLPIPLSLPLFLFSFSPLPSFSVQFSLCCTFKCVPFFLFSSSLAFFLLLTIWSLLAIFAVLVFLAFSDMSIAVLMSVLTFLLLPPLLFTSSSCSAFGSFSFWKLLFYAIVLSCHPFCLVSFSFSMFVSFLFSHGIPWLFLAYRLRVSLHPSIPVSPALSCLVPGTLISLNVSTLISARCLLFLEGLLVPCLFLLPFACITLLYLALTCFLLLLLLLLLLL